MERKVWPIGEKDSADLRIKKTTAQLKIRCEYSTAEVTGSEALRDLGAACLEAAAIAAKIEASADKEETAEDPLRI